MNLTRDARRLKTRCELNITPMIDCIFQLLIFFMVGMKFRELDRNLDASLPQSSERPSLKPPKPELLIRIRVRPDSPPGQPRPEVLIGGRILRDWAEIDRCLERLAAVPGATLDPVILAPDGAALNGWVARTLDRLRLLGFRDIAFCQ